MGRQSETLRSLGVAVASGVAGNTMDEQESVE
jgi:hypothetical protein